MFGDFTCDFTCDCFFRFLITQALAKTGRQIHAFVKNCENKQRLVPGLEENLVVFAPVNPNIRQVG